MNRLDIVTTGLVPLAKTAQGATRFWEEIRRDRVGKKYKALLTGPVPVGVLEHYMPGKSCVCFFLVVRFLPFLPFALASLYSVSPRFSSTGIRLLTSSSLYSRKNHPPSTRASRHQPPATRRVEGLSNPRPFLHACPYV